jgi:hypothetical protein
MTMVMEAPSWPKSSSAGLAAYFNTLPPLRPHILQRYLQSGNLDR